MNELYHDTDLLKCRVRLSVVNKVQMKNGGEKNQLKQCFWVECQDILKRIMCVLVSRTGFVFLPLTTFYMLSNSCAVQLKINDYFVVETHELLVLSIAVFLQELSVIINKINFRFIIIIVNVSLYTSVTADSLFKLVCVI